MEFYNQPQGPANILQRFNEFKKTFQGDPRQQVQQLLDSGRVTKEQYDQAVKMANQLYGQFHA